MDIKNTNDSHNERFRVFGILSEAFTYVSNFVRNGKITCPNLATFHFTFSFNQFD